MRITCCWKLKMLISNVIVKDYIIVKNDGDDINLLLKNNSLKSNH